MAREGLLKEHELQFGKDRLVCREIEGSPLARAKFKIIGFAKYPETEIEPTTYDINSCPDVVVSRAPSIQRLR
jgi:hypothetical protein